MNVSIKMLLYIAEPIIINIIEEMVHSYITAPNLIKIRDELFAKMTEWAGKTSFSIDDTLIKSIYEAIKNPGDGAKETSDTILDMIENWVTASETKWDDKALVPVIAAFREATGVIDGED